jgi:UDP-N-acetyl-2-amino-2-deoxyglucuronate dehydrogenase
MFGHMSQPRFALIGAAGFVAPRHMQAIKDVGGTLVAALDPHDSVGILDKFDRETEFFTEEHRFERHLEKLRREGNGIDWLTVCSPNYLHDTHIRMGLRAGAKVICEKPLVLDPKNLDALKEIEQEYSEWPGQAQGRKVFTVLQLRHVTELQALRSHGLPALKARQEREGRSLAKLPLICQLSYLTPRGHWYGRSWKGDPHKSGGIITNIGIHMFDLLLWLFGSLSRVETRSCTDTEAAGTLYFAGALIDWYLSIEGDRASRRLTVDGEIDISINGFENLHTTVYQETLAGRGHGIEDARPAVELAARLRR